MRDRDTDARLGAAGWHVIRIWEDDDVLEAAERVTRCVFIGARRIASAPTGPRRRARISFTTGSGFAIRSTVVQSEPLVCRVAGRRACDDVSHPHRPDPSAAYHRAVMKNDWRGERSLIAMALAVALNGVIAVAGQEPTLEETKAWLESEGARDLVGASKLGRSSSEVRLTEVKLDSCTLRYIVESNGDRWRAAVPLKDLDIGSITLEPENDLYTLRVQLKTRVAAGETITWTPVTTTKRTDVNVIKTDNDFIFVMSSNHGDRVARAVRRAALLCGAPAPPF